MLTGDEPVAAAGFLLARCAGKDKYFQVVDAVFRQEQDLLEIRPRRRRARPAAEGRRIGRHDRPADHRLHQRRHRADGAQQADQRRRPGGQDRLARRPSSSTARSTTAIRTRPRWTRRSPRRRPPRSEAQASQRRWGRRLALAALGGAAARAVPAAEPGDMALGSPTARVTVIEYASVGCPHCADWNNQFPVHQAKYIATGKVRLVVREMLTGDGTHGRGRLHAGPLRRAGEVLPGDRRDLSAPGQHVRAGAMRRSRSCATSPGRWPACPRRAVDACIADKNGQAAVNARNDRHLNVDKIDFDAHLLRQRQAARRRAGARRPRQGRPRSPAGGGRRRARAFPAPRLSGFKSFVEPTDFRIEPGLTGVVGPNGCGKSNLLEALRWVMGANSAKAMRGAGMDDVIFAGSGRRPGPQPRRGDAHHRQRRRRRAGRRSRRPSGAGGGAAHRPRRRLDLPGERPRGARPRRAAAVRRRLHRRQLAGAGPPGPDLRADRRQAAEPPADPGGGRRRLRPAHPPPRGRAEGARGGGQSGAARRPRPRAGRLARPAEARGAPGRALQETRRADPGAAGRAAARALGRGARDAGADRRRGAAPSAARPSARPAPPPPPARRRRGRSRAQAAARRGDRRRGHPAPPGDREGPARPRAGGRRRRARAPGGRDRPRSPPTRRARARSSRTPAAR